MSDKIIKIDLNEKLDYLGFEQKRLEARKKYAKGLQKAGLYGGSLILTGLILTFTMGFIGIVLMFIGLVAFFIIWIFQNLKARNVLKKVGALNEKNDVTMDYEWFAKFHLANLKGKRLPFFLAANRDRPETKTNTGGMKRYQNMIHIHAMRPGKPLIFRKSFWVYTLEALIKACNAIANTHRHGIFLNNIFNFISKVGNEIFLRFVNPRSTNDIIYRFQVDIVPKGRTIEDQWNTDDPK